jgi:hypothetical protein
MPQLKEAEGDKAPSSAMPRLKTKKLPPIMYAGNAPSLRRFVRFFQKKTKSPGKKMVPEHDGALRTVARAKIRHYRQLYINRPEPIAFMPVAVDMAGCIYEDFSRLLFLHVHREASALSNELPEESEQFRFLRSACFPNIKGSVGLILAKASAIRISIPLDLSSRPFIPL